MSEYMIELGIYHENPTIPPTVVVSGPYAEDFPTVGLLRELKLEAEKKLGAAVLDEQCFIRVFERAE